jgi:hypothetical protein
MIATIICSSCLLGLQKTATQPYISPNQSQAEKSSLEFIVFINE